MNTTDKAQRSQGDKETRRQGDKERKPGGVRGWGGLPLSPSPPLLIGGNGRVEDRREGRGCALWGLRGLISLVGVFLASTAFGEVDPAAFGEVTGHTTPDLVPMLGRTLLSLIVIGVLIYLVLFLLRKSLYRRWRGGDGGDLVSVLGSTFMGPKKAVYLLKVMDRILIVGVTDAHISLLSEITEASAVESAIHASGHGDLASPSRFFEHLDAFVTRLKKGERNAQGKV